MIHDALSIFVVLLFSASVAGVGVGAWRAITEEDGWLWVGLVVLSVLTGLLAWDHMEAHPEPFQDHPAADTQPDEGESDG